MGLPAKQVRFPEEEENLFKVVCEIPCREDLSSEEVEETFFSKADYASSRQITKRISRDCQRQSASKSLDETFVEKNSETQDRLNEWALHGQERRGLERWSNREHGEKRQQDQFQAVMTVLQAQDEMLAEHKSVDDEKLRKVSHKATKTARHFARMMGKADSYAVENEHLVDDTASVQTAGTDHSSVSACTEETEDISLPRMHEDLNDSRHAGSSSKSKRLYSRLPNFLTRSRSRHGKGVKEEPQLQPVKVRES